jgi:hypothetical protein
MNPETEIDRRTMSYGDMVKQLISAGNIKAAFINYIDSELIIVIKDDFTPQSLESIRERLPIWLEGAKHDPGVFYSVSCTRICKITTTEIEGSPNRLLLMYPELERIL